MARIRGYGAVRKVTLRCELPAPIVEVWRQLTEVQEIQRWWPDWHPGGVLEPREGGRVLLGDGSWIDGRIKVWAPPYILEYTWRDAATGGDWYEAATKSLVRFDLVESSRESTMVQLTQFMPETSVVGGTAGWHRFLERLWELLDTGSVTECAGRFDELVGFYSEASSPSRFESKTECQITLDGLMTVRRLMVEIAIEESPERVWRALTEGSEVASWWAAGRVDPFEGGRVVLDDGNELSGTVKVSLPPRLFEYTWNDRPERAGHAHWLEHQTKSLVRFEVLQVALEKSLVTVVQYSPAASASGAAEGWGELLTSMKSYVEHDD